MIGMSMAVDAFWCGITADGITASVSMDSPEADVLGEGWFLQVGMDAPDSVVECFVTVTDDYGYGFTLYDLYAYGERRYR